MSGEDIPRACCGPVRRGLVLSKTTSEKESGRALRRRKTKLAWNDSSVLTAMTRKVSRLRHRIEAKGLHRALRPVFLRLFVRLNPFERKLKRLSADCVQNSGLENWYGNHVVLEKDYFFDALTIVRRTFDKDSSILDTGCGIGQSCHELFYYGYRNIVGVDIDEMKIMCARKIHGKLFPDCGKGGGRVQFVVADCSDLPMHAKFDTILALNWVGIAGVTKKFLLNVRKNMKNSSLLIFDVFDRKKMLEAENLWSVSYISETFNLEEILDLVEKLGYKVVKILGHYDIRRVLYVSLSEQS